MVRKQSISHTVHTATGCVCVCVFLGTHVSVCDCCVCYSVVYVAKHTQQPRSVCSLNMWYSLYMCVCVCVCVCVLPVCFDDAFSDGVSYLVENVSVVCTADEELILKERQTNKHTNVFNDQEL